jgi:hypothetical protein
VKSDHVDAWRAFYAELTGPRRAEWAQSQRRHGIRRESIWLVGEAEHARAVVLIEGPDPGAARRSLAASPDPFDLWYRGRLAEMVGEAELGESVFDSRPRPGTWRGLTGRRRR